MHGWQHTLVNLSLLTPLAGTALLLHRVDLLLPFAATFLAGTLLVTPDLDLRHNDAARRWGGWRFIWAPYAAVSKHRGMSHSWLAGPVLRLLYLAVWAAPVAYLAVRLGGLPLLWPDAATRALLLGGYLLSQWLHLLCDGLLPGGLRLRRSG